MDKTNKTQKKKQISGGIAALVVIAIIVAFMVFSAQGGPTRITTDEGLTLLRGNTVEKVVINDGTQTVSMELTKSYQRPRAYLPKDGPFGMKPNADAGKKSFFFLCSSPSGNRCECGSRRETKEGF